MSPLTSTNSLMKYFSILHLKEFATVADLKLSGRLFQVLGFTLR